MAGFTASLFAACAAWLGVRSASASRRRTSQASSPPEAHSGLLRLGAVALCALGVAVFLGGVVGVVVAAVLAFGLHRWLASTTSTAELRRLSHRRAELPTIVDLLAACLLAGSPVPRALQIVAREASTDLRDDLLRVAVALDLGASAEEAWQLVSTTDLASVAESMQRSAFSGAPSAAILSQLAADLRGQFRNECMAKARGLGVRTAGPLGLCFLPAFVLIAVIPLVISLVANWS